MWQKAGLCCLTSRNVVKRCIVCIVVRALPRTKACEHLRTSLQIEHKNFRT